MIKNFQGEAFLDVNLDIKKALDEGTFDSLSQYMDLSGEEEIKHGYRPFHKDFEPYDEELYLSTFPEVKEAVEKGVFVRGFGHFYHHGYQEIILGHRSWKRIGISSDSASSINGHIERYEGGQLDGWVLKPNHLDEKVKLQVLVDGVVAGETTADIYRSDLVGAFGGDGKHSFKLVIKHLSKDNKLGLVTLKEAETLEDIPANKFSIKYDLDQFSMPEDKIDSFLSENKVEILNAYNMATKYYQSKQFEKARQVIEGLIKREEKIPDSLYTRLLNIYLAEENNIAVVELYRSVIDNKTLLTLQNKFHEKILSYCATLWMNEPGEYLSSLEIHKLELLFIILDHMDVVDEELLFDRSENLHNFIGYLLKSGFLLDNSSLKKLSMFIIDNTTFDEELEKEISLYSEHLPFVELLLTAMHTVDSAKLKDIHMYLHVLEDNEDNSYIKYLFEIYLIYVEVLINAGRLSREAADSVLDLITKKVEKIVHNKDKLNPIYLDLYYIVENFDKALPKFRHYLDNLHLLEWRCRYLPEMLWLYFKTSGFKIDNENVSKFIYTRYADKRASYIEHSMLLSEIDKYSESVNTTRLYQIVKYLILNYFSEKNEEVLLFIEEMLNRLLYSTIDDYLDKSKELNNYLKGINPKPHYDFHHSELFELQNLYYLSIVNTHAGQVDFNMNIKYRNLLSTEKRLEFHDSIPIDKKVSVISVVDDLYEKLYTDYYQDLLLFSNTDSMIIYLYFSRYYYMIKREEGKVATVKESYEQFKNSVDILKEIDSQHYMILNQGAIVHHNSLNGIAFDDNTCFSPLGLEQNGYSFSVDAGLFKFILDDKELGKPETISETIWQMQKMLKEYTCPEQMTDEKHKQGIISFQNIDTSLIPLLTNYNHPVLELDEREKSLAYLSGLYSDPRIDTILNINIGDVSMSLVKSFGIEENEDDLACFLVQRNEYLRLEGFLEYYRDLGIDKFYIVDNGSDDGKTMDYLLEQKDVELYSTVQAYSQSLFGIKWVELLIRTKRLDKWNLVVDADELLYSDMEFDNLKDQCKALERDGFDSLYTPFLDMYSNESLNQTKYAKGSEILNTCAFYDRHFYTLFNPYGGIMGVTNTYQGGLRSRVFGLKTVILNKLPLFKFHPGQKLREGLHWIDGSNPAYGKSVLLHFKYIETFHQYVINEIARGQHWNGASEYKQYYHFLTANPTFSLYDETLSAKFTSVKDFYDNLFKPFHLQEKN